ncbi:MAG: hypothetical protein P8100_16320 [bacterium]|jgi:hypothetical protein
MKSYFSKLFSTPYRKITVGLLVTGVCFILAALIAGIADNLPGIILLFIGLLALMFSLIHPWRETKSYLILLIVSLAGGVLFAVLHNIFHALSIKLADLKFIADLFEVAGAVSFVIAVLICPVGLLIGFFGTILTYFLRQNPQRKAE